MCELTVILPAYNEEDNISELTERWQNEKERLEKEGGCRLRIVAVNDGSSDNTEKIARKLEEEYDNFTLVNHDSNKGLGEAVKTGILYTLDKFPSCEYTCIMDCDNTHDPRFVHSMLKKQREAKADVVIASRYQNSSRIKGVSSFRLFTSEGARYVYSLLLGVKNVRDYTCGYRLYNNDILKKAHERFGGELIQESGFSCMAELLYKLYASGASFAEVPFELRYDFKKGASKMKVIKTAIDSFKLAYRLRKIPLEV